MQCHTGVIMYSVYSAQVKQYVESGLAAFRSKSGFNSCIQNLFQGNPETAKSLQNFAKNPEAACPLEPFRFSMSVC